jgi:hypothetical protein
VVETINTARYAIRRSRDTNFCFSVLVVNIPPFTGATEEYNGSTWTSNPTGLNTARAFLGGCGTQTAALGFGGELPGSPNITTATEEYDGSTWTTNPPGSLNTARSTI